MLFPMWKIRGDITVGKLLDTTLSEYSTDHFDITYLVCGPVKRTLLRTKELLRNMKLYIVPNQNMFEFEGA
jgi:hypothetical protein